MAVFFAFWKNKGSIFPNKKLEKSSRINFFIMKIMQLAGEFFELTLFGLFPFCERGRKVGAQFSRD